jgi:hypothetical protein
LWLSYYIRVFLKFLKDNATLLHNILAIVGKGYLEHQATLAKLGAHMGLGYQVLQL